MTSRRRSAVRYLLGACGVGIMAAASWSLVTGGTLTAPASLVKWLVVPVLAHDLVIAPLACAVAAASHRLLPEPTRRIVLAGLGIAAVVALVGLPLLLAPGGSNPTVLPRDYPRGLAVTIAVVLGATAVAVVEAEVRRRAARTERSG